MIDNTAKYLRAIAAAAVVLTILMIGYTMTAATNGNRSFNVNSESQTTGQSPHQNSVGEPVPETLFPINLAGMVMVQSFTGQEAINAVSSLLGSNLKVNKGYLVAYQGLEGSQMMIWLGETQNEQDAAALFRAIGTKMSSSQNFSNYKTLSINGKHYKSVTGTQLQNYYWLSGNRVIWVGIGGTHDSEAIFQQIVSLY